MIARTQKATWISAGLMLALVSGVPAVADDTELLLAAPPAGSTGKPNVLFIIDTSGSMKKNNNTLAPYKSATTYGGACDPTKRYWSKTGALPDCSVSTSYVDASDFHCDDASGKIAGLGNYTGTLAQYRNGGPDGNSGGPRKWQTLAAGKNLEPIECRSDAGDHGDGTAGYLWPKAGNGGPNDAYTNVESESISWGSAPVSTTYTVFSGNYINWKNNPTIISQPRWVTVRDVLVPLFTALDNINVGMMRFSSTHTANVWMAMKDLEANRAQAISVASTAPLDVGTPLDRTMVEAAAYWTGINAITGNPPVDALAMNPAPTYRKPPAPTGCAKNFNIYLSDGNKSDSDRAAPDYVNRLPGWSAWNGTTGCHGTDLTKNGNQRAGQECLDDVAAYLYEREENVHSFFIGFEISEPSMEKAAGRSGGEYYEASDYETLAASMLDIFTAVNETSLSFAAAAVPVNGFNRTQNLNALYLPVFTPSNNIHWPGNLKKYKIEDGKIVDASGADAVDPATGYFKESATSIWTSGGSDGHTAELGGAAHKLPAPADRKLYTNNSGTVLTDVVNRVKASNAGAFSDADLGLTGAAGEPSKTDLLDWMNGVDVRDEDDDPSTTVRNVMGDPLHSQPAAVLYGGSEASPDLVVFTGSNDGYLHAVDGNTGVELWSFIPHELLENMSSLYFDPKASFKNYGVDGNLVSVVTDDNNNGIIDGSDFAYLIFGLRRGGHSYFALDVTNKNAPKLLWTKTLTNGGQSWSTPVVTRVDVNAAGTNANKAVVILGGGYDSVQDTNAYTATPDAEGAGVHMLDLVSGAELWRAGSDGPADLTVSGMTRSIPNDIRVIDLTGDGFADRMYASDTGGQILRFDIDNGAAPTSLVAGGVIAQLGAEGSGSPTTAMNRRFYNAPDVSMFTDQAQNKRYISVSIGSGYRAHPLDNDAADKFFSVRDPDVFNSLTQSDYNSYDIATVADLVEVSGSVRTVIPPSKRGWMFTLPSDRKVLADSVTFDDTVFFVGFSPEQDLSDPCQPANGKNYLYKVRVENGDPALDSSNLETLSAEDADDEREDELDQAGIAPTPAIFFPSPDDPDCTGDECTPPPLFCVGVECGDPGFDNIPVRTVWTSDGAE